MWDSVIPKSNCSWEPLELRILKQELANMVCKCHACASLRDPSAHREHAECNDEATQVGQKNLLLNQYIYANSDLPPGVDELHPNKTDYLRFCPNCYFIWDLLRLAKKVYKDQESETKPDYTDKATEKLVKFVDSSTSAPKLTNELPQKAMSSNITFCDFLSDCSSNSYSTNQSVKKSVHTNQSIKNLERVAFLEDFPHVDASKVKPTITNTIHGNCFCLDSYMDSIRPPLNNFQ